MSYTKQTWQNLPSTSTPISAERLTYIENGIKANSDSIDAINEIVPPVEETFTVQGGSLGTQPTFSGAPLFSGSYVKSGPMVHFQIQVDFTNITSFGTGQYYVDLPFASKHAYQVRAGCLHHTSTGRDYSIGGHVNEGSSRLVLNSSGISGQSVFDVPFTSTAPVTLTTADNFHISGTYITED